MFLDLQVRMQILERTLLETYYDFMMTLLIYMDFEIRILSCQELLEKKNALFLSNQLSHIFDDLYQAPVLGW